MATLTQNVMQWTLPGGDIAQMGVWVQYSGSPTAAQARVAFDTDFVTSVWPSAAGGLKGLYSSSTLLAQLETRIVDPATNRVTSNSKASYSRAGTSSAPLPAEVAIAVTLRTGLSGGSFRGRVYLPPVGTANVDTLGNLLNTSQATIVTVFTTALTAIKADATYGSANPIVYSRKLHAESPITSFDVGNVFDVQRRRRNRQAETRSGASV